MSDQGKSATGVGIGVGGGVGVGAAEIGGVSDVVSFSVGDAVGVLSVGGLLGVLGLLCRIVVGVLGFLGEVFVGIVVGGGIVTLVGFLLLSFVSVAVEVGERRSAQIPVYLRTIPPLAPRTLRWVRGLLPSGEGAAWLAEVTFCLAEAHDKDERRRYIRSYRRRVPQLIWTSWALYLGGSRSRNLS